MIITLVVPKHISSHFEPPLGFGYLLHIIKNLGIQCSIIDENLLDSTDKWISTTSGDVFFLTSYYTNSPRAIKIVHDLRSYNKNAIIVFGGPHFSYCGLEYLNQGEIDFLIIGEAEHFIPELIYNIQKQISGHQVKRRIFGPSLDPSNSWRKINPLKQIDLSQYGKFSNEIGILISRGCPYDCAFCIATSFWGRKIRVKDLLIIEEMIRQIQESNFEIVSLWDDSLWSLINTKTGKEIIAILSIYRSSLKWRTHLRVDQLIEKNIKTLANAGCITIRVGVESLISASQKSIGKEFRVEELEKGLQIAQQFGIEVWCSMIIGLPGDTYDAVVETMDIMQTLLLRGFVNHVDFRPLTVLPGSKFHRYFLDYGFTRIIENHYSPKDVSVVNTSINFNEIDRLLEKYNDFLLPLSKIRNFRN